MSQIPDDLQYTREHEWGRLDVDGRITVGITDFAQEQMGDVVYLDLPAVGQALEGGEPMGEVESTKSVSDIFSPVTGTCAEVNVEAKDNPAALNQDPYGEGWLIVVEPSDATEFEGLMSAEEYESFCSDAPAQED
ncbi:MAG: glycine cleavage system protein GcvH [Actinomycetota bacterium]